MKTKKEILKKYTGKGGPNNAPTPFQQIGGAVRDTVNNIGNGVARGIAGIINANTKDDDANSSDAQKMVDTNKDNSHGGRYVPDTTKTLPNIVNKQVKPNINMKNIKPYISKNK